MPYGHGSGLSHEPHGVDCLDSTSRGGESCLISPTCSVEAVIAMHNVQHTCNAYCEPAKRLHCMQMLIEDLPHLSETIVLKDAQTFYADQPATPIRVKRAVEASVDIFVHTPGMQHWDNGRRITCEEVLQHNMVPWLIWLLVDDGVCFDA